MSMNTSLKTISWHSFILPSLCNVMSCDSGGKLFFKQLVFLEATSLSCFDSNRTRDKMSVQKSDDLFFLKVMFLVIEVCFKRATFQTLTSSTVSGMHILYSFSNIAVGGYTRKSDTVIESSFWSSIQPQLSKLAQLWFCWTRHANSPARGLCTKAEISKCLLKSFFLLAYSNNRISEKPNCNFLRTCPIDGAGRKSHGQNTHQNAIEVMTTESHIYGKKGKAAWRVML